MRNIIMKKNNNFGVMFPGQGSQFPGMGKPYEKIKGSFKENFDLGSELLGLDLGSLRLMKSLLT